LCSEDYEKRQGVKMDYVAARQNMVDCQVRPNKVTDPLVISTLREIPREIFVPADKKGTSYLDADVEIAPGRVIMQPMVFARLVQLAEIRRNDAILDVGCGDQEKHLLFWPRWVAVSLPWKKMLNWQSRHLKRFWTM